ncbi:MAG: response regulator [Acidobacteriia bacterium]|nr:response regulator [Terriglobia bacterium]
MARKILLADDSVTAQNMGRKILSDAGYDVVTVNNGSAALKRVAELKPDLIVLDVYMPGYSGLEVCQRLKDSPDTERIPILLTVGKLEPFKPEEARRVRADAYIIKPFEASELLSALTRMEDQMVPGQGDGSRFSGGSRRSENDGDPDTGWKNRLRFPSKKKKEEFEPEPETDFTTGPSFRNFRRSKKASSAGKAAPAPMEPTVVPDIPRDITPEELDALSALAAKLDAPASAPEETAVAAVEQAAVTQAKPEFEVSAPSGEQKIAGEFPVAPPEPTGEAEPSATNAVADASAAVIAPEPAAASETKPAETVHVETFAAEPAPVDGQDEPVFATAAGAVELAPQEEKTEVQEVAVASSEAAAAANPPETPAIQAKAEEQKPDEPKVEEAPKVVEAVQAEETPSAELAPKIEETPQTEVPSEAAPVAAAAEEAAIGPAPSEEELAEALRLLTPALAHTDPSSMPTRETLVAAGAVLAEQVARNAAEGPRWTAVAVALSSEEAALSLEKEMFRTLAGTAAEGSDSAATAATAAMSPTAVASEPVAEVKPDILAEAPAETLAAVPSAVSETDSPSVAEVQAEQKDSPAKVAAEAAEEPAAATFADAVEHNEVSAQPGTEPASEAAVPAEEVGPPVVETMEVPTSEAVGDEEVMAKERANTGKSTWHQLRKGAPAAGTSDVVEAAKQAEPAEEAPKAMAAAAAAENTGASPAAPDAKAIASIVDSVLADLRPKIVEEIAKKLAGK